MRHAGVKTRLRYLLGLLVIFVAAPAFAKVELETHGGTVVPLLVGGGAELKLPYRLRLGVRAGYMPPGYVDLINEVLLMVGVDESTTDLIKIALDNSLIVGADIGWYPFSRWGFYVAGGSTIATLGGGATAAELIAAVTGKPVPENVAGGDIKALSTLYTLVFQLGYRWMLYRGLDLRAELGVLYCFASKSALEFENVRNEEQAAQASSDFDAYMNDIYTTYVITPTVGLTLGYRFF